MALGGALWLHDSSSTRERERCIKEEAEANAAEVLGDAHAADQKWNAQEWPSSPERGREFQSDRGIVVRNTFIDVCPLEEESDGDGEGGSCASPQQRRNLSAPPSPTRQRKEGKKGSVWDTEDATGVNYPDSDQEEEEDPGAIPNYQWADGGLVAAEGVEPPEATASEDGWGCDPQHHLPTWLQKPPGSPKRVQPTELQKGRVKGSAEGQPPPALGEFLKGGIAPWGPHLGHGCAFPPGSHGGFDARASHFGAGPPGHHLAPPGPPAQLHPGAAGQHHGLGHGLGFGGCGGTAADSYGRGQDWGPSPYSQNFGPPTSQAVLSHRVPPSGMIHLPLPGERLGACDQVLWRHDASSSELEARREPPSLPLEPPPGAAYISDNPPPRDPLGGHIPTEAPAYILGSTGSATTSAPVLASQPLPPQQAVDASRRRSGAGPPGPPQASGQPPGKCSGYGDLKGMPAFQVAHGMNAGGHRYDGGGIPGLSGGGCRPMPGDGGGYPSLGSAHSGGPFPISRSIGAGASPAGPVMPSERQSRYGSHGIGTRGSGTAEDVRRGRAPGGGGVRSSLEVGGSTAGSNQQEHSGPWISPSAMRDMPWLSPSAMDAACGLSDGRPEGQPRSGKGSRGGGVQREDRNTDAGGKGEAKGRVPLSGGGPKRTDYIKKYGAAGEIEGSGSSVPVTTMMLKNIPCRKGQEEVMHHIDTKGFANRFDFFYLPRDVKFRANLGYAFINFLTPEDASRFENEMNGYRFTGSGSTKACAVVPAHVQGLMNNLAAFKRTEVMRSSRKPYFSSVVTL